MGAPGRGVTRGSSRPAQHRRATPWLHDAAEAVRLLTSRLPHAHSTQTRPHDGGTSPAVPGVAPPALSRVETAPAPRRPSKRGVRLIKIEIFLVLLEPVRHQLRGAGAVPAAGRV